MYDLDFVIFFLETFCVATMNMQININKGKKRRIDKHIRGHMRISLQPLLSPAIYIDISYIRASWQLALTRIRELMHAAFPRACLIQLTLF